MTRSARLLFALALPAALAALGCPSQPAVVVVAPSPSAAPSTAASATSSATAAASPSPAPSVAAGFREDFDGPSLAPAVWSAFPQSGILHFDSGHLELINSSGTKNYPYLVTKNPIIPASGPWYFEMSFAVVTQGTPPSFSLDYLPADGPGDMPLTSPFMSTTTFYNALRMNFVTENGVKTYDGAKGNQPGAFHRLRVENDGQLNYRVIFDQTELGRFTSKRRPQKFWLGQNPPKDANIAVPSWQRLQLDYVAAGTLDTPDPATPEGPATGAASAATGAASPAPSPSAG